MASEGTSDGRIGEALIKEVIQEQLKEVSSEEVPSLSLQTLEVQNEQEEKMVTQLGAMIQRIGDRLKDEPDLQDTIDGLVVSGKAASQKNYRKVVTIVFSDGQITWERIALLFYVAGKMAVKMVEIHLSPLVMDILNWTLEYFRSKLLVWVQQHGGWINSFSDIARYQMDKVSSMGTKNTGFLLIFVLGLAVGSLITWTVAKRT